MSPTGLTAVYRRYIDCLNRQDWPDLETFVADDVIHDSRPIGLSGYRAMLEQNYREIPDLRFHIDLLLCEPPRVASRLRFDCTPVGEFLGLAVNGRRVCFTENVFYEFEDRKIKEVWSVIDKAAIEASLL